MLKKYRKLWKRKKFAMLIVPIIAIPLIAYSLLSFLGVGAEMEYKLITDLNGIRWQYGFNPSSNTLEVSFYDGENVPSNMTIPEKDFFILNDSSISAIDNYVFTSYEYHDYDAPETFNETVTKLDLSNADTVNGVSPLVNTTTQTEIILNPNGSAIGKDAFRNRKIDIKNLDEVTSIGPGAFYNTYFKNTIFKFDYLDTLGVGAFEKSNIMQVELNPEVIETSAFKNCTSLATVKFLNNVKTIYDSAFEGDYNLELVDFGKVETIRNNAFRYCSSFNQDLKNTNITTLGTGVFWGTTGFTIPVTLPDGVTTISWRTFYGSNIKEVDLNHVTSIGAEAFEECQQLTTINFGIVETINWKAFFGDKKLENIDMPDTIQRIEVQAFENCSIKNADLGNVTFINFRAFARNNLEELTLPKALESINTIQVFNDNPITKVTIKSDTMKWGNYNNNLYLYLGLDTYMNVETVELVAPYGENDEVDLSSRNYRNPYSGGNNYDINPDYGNALSYKNVLQSLTLWNMIGLKTFIVGEGYEFLGGEQFTMSTKLQKVVLPSTLKGIGSMAFSSSLIVDDVEIELPTSLEYIGYQAFYDSYKMHINVDIPELKFIAPGAFTSSGITGIAYHNKIEYIGTQHAVGTRDLRNILIDCNFFSSPINHDYQKTFGYAFGVGYVSIGTTPQVKYDTITLGENFNELPAAGSYDYSIFYNLKADVFDAENWGVTNENGSALSAVFQQIRVNEFKFPKNLKTIGRRWFYRAKIETPFELPESVTRIEDNAFQGAIVEGTLPSHLRYIGNGAFWDCLFNTNLVIPREVSYIGTCAFGSYYYYYSYSDDMDVYGGTSHTLYRDSVTFLCSLTTSTINDNGIQGLFWQTSIGELIFGNNVTELPTTARNNNKTVYDGTPEFYLMRARKVTFKNLKAVPLKAFLFNNYIEEVDFSKDNALEEIGENAFFGTPMLRKVKLPKGINLTIKSHAFSYSGLESIGDENSGLDIINNNITLDGECAFQYCFYLQDVKLTSAFNNGIITDGTFADCTSLKKVILDETIQEIQQNAFAWDDSANHNYGDSTSYANAFSFDHNTSYYSSSPYDTTYSYNDYADQFDHAIVMYGDTTIDEPALKQTITFTNTNNYSSFYLRFMSNVGGVSVHLEKTTISGSTSEYTYSSANSISTSNGDTITATILSGDEYYLTLKNSEVWVHRKHYTSNGFNNPSYTTIYSKYDLYCYQSNTKCQEYYDAHNQEMEDAYKAHLYYLDEIVHIDANKRNVTMNASNTDFDKEDLILYALRRDGILLVTDGNQQYTEAVKYQDSGITLLTYHPTEVDAEHRVFNTTRDISDLNVNASENFENVTYRIGEADPDTGRIYITMEYPNKVGSQSTAVNVLKTKGNFADVVYSDGCEGDSFGLYTYSNVLVGDETPQYTGTPERDGYEFVGWDQEIEDTTTGDVVYTAQWRKIEVPEDDDEDDDEDDYYDPMPEDLPDPMDGFINPQTGITLLLLIPLLTSIVFITKLKRKRVQA